MINIKNFSSPEDQNPHNLDKDAGIKIFFNSLLNIFPAALLGMESTNATRLIFLNGATYRSVIGKDDIYIYI